MALATLSLATVVAGSISEHDFLPLVSLENKVGCLPPSKFAAIALRWAITVNPLTKGEKNLQETGEFESKI